MSKRTEEHKQDSQYRKAKRQGYRARSAFKLFEIQKRFNVFKRSFYILDLGSAPGSWLQVSKKLATENIDKYKDGFYHRDHFKILGVDPYDNDILVIKSGMVRPNPDGTSRGALYLNVDGPGLTSSNLKYFTYKNIGRPKWPFDENPFG